jgi:hypothetical protein
MAIYRRRKGDYDSWHFCANCSDYPTTNYIEQHEKPASGEFRSECTVKRAAGTCH